MGSDDIVDIYLALSVAIYTLKWALELNTISVKTTYPCTTHYRYVFDVKKNQPNNNNHG